MVSGSVKYIGDWVMGWASTAIFGILAAAGGSGGIGLLLHLVATDARGAPTPEARALIGIAISGLLAAGGILGIRARFVDNAEGWPPIAAFALATALATGLYAEDGIGLALRGAVLAAIGLALATASAIRTA